ncbi:3-phosphoshikimate 1-carboxyvinyltransferase [Rhodopirellula baltica]|uniref:3-phosphoshikimate 1-carboxyvinyltransferase n=1 Tax=Rhodopirellula baltica WH47 TaxID=991778 RepID=F2AW33_RHOBT|nr:3-phosphoshikimate 1-carboxyvinyltransferase [Rhodopirellula baltica]EGF26137.1 bifunctional prephenate dehydrogenase/3-phosphoshikimate 1-carboxyvinyltransferase [Rhodopirellula baltica WH47]
MNSTTESPSDAIATVRVIPGGPVCGSIRPPGSKSLTNRALLMAAFGRGTSQLEGALVSEDTHVMTDSLRKIGVEIESHDAGRTLVVTGVQSAPESDSPYDLYIANSGTTVRFLTAALSALGGNYVLSGVPRMHERPIGDLVDALSPVVDGRIEAVSEGGCPPVHIQTAGWAKHELSVAGSVSSQYLSGLMMAAPLASRRSSQPVTIRVVGELVSRPYVEMTADAMQVFGASVGLQWPAAAQDDVLVQISGDYDAIGWSIEPDASAASYFWAAAAISGGDVTVNGLSRAATQGDVAFVDVLEMMGCQIEEGDDSIRVIATNLPGGQLRGVDVDMNAISDTVQTLAMVALFASSPTRVRGVAHNRFKETDRIGDLACELRKLGATIQEHDDGMTIHPLSEPAVSDESPVRLDTYHDHRMAMSFSLAGLRLGGIEIENPACTGKTYPNYWSDLEQLIGRAHHWTAE